MIKIKFPTSEDDFEKAAESATQQVTQKAGKVVDQTVQQAIKQTDNAISDFLYGPSNSPTDTTDLQAGNATDQVSQAAKKAMSQNQLSQKAGAAALLTGQKSLPQTPEEQKKKLEHNTLHMQNYYDPYIRFPLDQHLTPLEEQVKRLQQQRQQEEEERKKQEEEEELEKKKQAEEARTKQLVVPKGKSRRDFSISTRMGQTRTETRSRTDT